MSDASYRVLLVGNGGREHALAWKLTQATSSVQVFVVPGNGGTAGLENVTNIDNVKADDFDGLVKFAKSNDVNYLIPGPEAPLVAGIIDHFNQHLPNVKCFGPTKAAAELEGSKTLSKNFMHKYNIPTATYENFNDYTEARLYLDSINHHVVIKASGLAAGKGVIIPQSKEEAHAALDDIMVKKEFGSAGNAVVIEEFLEGEEISILTFCDGTNVCSLPPAQDHKRIYDGDKGPNTGGMGTYAPVNVVSQELLDEINRTVLKPTIDGMKQEGHPFRGCLFTGFMLTKSGPKVLEYNVRFGDPETQSCLPLMKTPLMDVIAASCDGNLDKMKLEVNDAHAVTVVVAAGGYPGSYAKGTEMKLDPVADGMPTSLLPQV